MAAPSWPCTHWQLTIHNLHQKERAIVMNPVRHTRRLAAALAGLAGALLAFAATAPAAFARPVPPSDIHQPVHLGPAPVPVHTVVVGGMSGWQITLIAVGAALLAAALAVLLDRAWRHADTRAQALLEP
jgi:hypothetical protein